MKRQTERNTLIGDSAYLVSILYRGIKMHNLRRNMCADNLKILEETFNECVDNMKALETKFNFLPKYHVKKKNAS